MGGFNKKAKTVKKHHNNQVYIFLALIFRLTQKTVLFTKGYCKFYFL